jgi:hypothetical protein
MRGEQVDQSVQDGWWVGHGQEHLLEKLSIDEGLDSWVGNIL